MSLTPISVFIIAKNEADRIPYAIKSVAGWVDEVIVIDSGSSDNTVEVSKSFGARVVFNEWKGYGAQKIFGESLCQNEWILNIDADEAVSERLAEEIKQLFEHKKTPPLKAYRFPIRIMSHFAEKPSLFAPSNDPIRFYNKKHAGFKDSTVHDSVVFHSGKIEKVGKMKGELRHRCFRSYRHAVEKINFYTTMQAKDMLKKGRKPSAIRIILEPFVAFLKAYTLRRYCFLGVDGFIESVIYAFARTLRLAKARELFKAKTQP